MPALCNFGDCTGVGLRLTTGIGFRLHWTLPKLSTPQQCEGWSDLLPLITWQLWLARDCETILCLGRSNSLLSPGRVVQAMGGGGDWHTGCCAQTRGKSPGWPTGKTACVEFANSQKRLLNQLNNFQSRLEPLIVLF